MAASHDKFCRVSQRYPDRQCGNEGRFLQRILRDIHDAVNIIETKEISSGKENIFQIYPDDRYWRILISEYCRSFSINQSIIQASKENFICTIPFPLISLKRFFVQFIFLSAVACTLPILYTTCNIECAEEIYPAPLKNIQIQT